MKIKHLLLIICLLYSGIVSAQNNLFSKYADKEDVTVVNISKTMLKMIKGYSIGNVNMNKVKDKIDNIKVLTSDKKGLKEMMYEDFKSAISKDKNYEELMTIKDGKSNVTFNARKKGDIISELIMLVNDEDDFVAIQLLGNFTLEDIQNIME